MCVCILTLVTRQANRIFSLRIMLSSVAYTIQYFSTLPHKRNDFRKPVIELKKKCVLIFCKTFVWNISHYYKRNWVRCYHKRSQVVMPSTRYSCHILMKFVFSPTYFRKIFKYKISWTSVQWQPACSTRTDRLTNTTRLNSHFSLLCESVWKLQIKN